MEDLVVLNTAVLMGRIITRCLSLSTISFIVCFSSLLSFALNRNHFLPGTAVKSYIQWWPCSHPVQFSFGGVTIIFFFLHTQAAFELHTHHIQLSGKQSPPLEDPEPLLPLYCLVLAGAEPPASFLQREVLLQKTCRLTCLLFPEYPILRFILSGSSKSGSAP